MGGAMNRSEIVSAVLGVLKRYEGRGGNHEPLTESTLLADELDVDSVRMVDITLDLEEKFGVSIDDSKAANLKRVSDVVELIDGMLNVAKAR
jgi:acyl carrier protein